jgi:hypothetical protein
MGQYFHHPIPQAFNFYPKFSPDLLGGQLETSLRFGIDKINDGLSLSQVYPTVNKGPERELSWFGKTGTRTEDNLQNRGKKEITTVRVYFHHILSSIGMGGSHEGEENLINDLLRRGVNQIPQIQAVASKVFGRVFRSEYLLSDFSGARPGQADDANPCLTNGCGHGSDGIFIFVV